jgi:hypothetical protein
MRAQMVHEIMYPSASVLPEAYRGNYADMTKKTEQYLAFQEG